MTKLKKEFFSDGEILLVGYSSKNNAFSKEVYKTLVRSGIKVYPVNSRSDVSFDVKVYKNLDELPAVPKSACVLLKKDNAKKVIQELADHGVKRVLFQNKGNFDVDSENECSKLGMEVMVGCPMMIYGKGLHKFHAFFAGVR